MNTERPEKGSIPVTVIIAARDEAGNLPACLKSLLPARRIVLVDSHSTDDTVGIAKDLGAEVVQFDYKGGYPRKRQWALDNLDISTGWIMLIDADEQVTTEMWCEIRDKLELEVNAFLAKKAFHFLGKRMRFGGFSHSAVALFRKGKARFEELAVEEMDDGFDMEVHERLKVDGVIGKLKAPLLHKDVKSVERYIARHRGYAKWEARVRYNYLKTGSWGSGLKGSLFGDVQQKRRFLKAIAIRMPFEPLCWLLYHYVLRLGFMEGRAGYQASIIRARYIGWVRQRLRTMSRKSS